MRIVVRSFVATYVFTDIHGHAKPLRRILERIAPQDEDQFICLGDMIDRGPDPLGVIETVKTLPHVVVLQGNHEQMLGCDKLVSVQHAIVQRTMSTWSVS